MLSIRVEELISDYFFFFSRNYCSYVWGLGWQFSDQPKDVILKHFAGSSPKPLWHGLFLNQPWINSQQCKFCTKEIKCRSSDWGVFSQDLCEWDCEKRNCSKPILWRWRRQRVPRLSVNRVQRGALQGLQVWGSQTNMARHGPVSDMLARQEASSHWACSPLPSLCPVNRHECPCSKWPCISKRHPLANRHCCIEGSLLGGDAMLAGPLSPWPARSCKPQKAKLLGSMLAGNISLCRDVLSSEQHVSHNRTWWIWSATNPTEWRFSIIFVLFCCLLLIKECYCTPFQEQAADAQP